MAALLAGAVLAGCPGDEGRSPARDPGADPSAATSTGGDIPGAGTPTERPTLVFLGTSLTAGYGLEDPDSAYPALIQRKIDSAGLPYEVVNAGVSGETSAGALRRIDWILRHPPAVLVIESGANDMLRGQDIDSLRANIQAMIDRVRQRSPDTRIVLAAMEAMPNLGRAYARRFRAVYTDLARENGLPLLPFILDRVAAVESLNQGDGIHPNEAGARLVADNAWKALLPILQGTDRR
jgi:acyl-CoA thioesterase-1